MDKDPGRIKHLSKQVLHLKIDSVKRLLNRYLEMDSEYDSQIEMLHDGGYKTKLKAKKELAEEVLQILDEEF